MIKATNWIVPQPLHFSPDAWHLILYDTQQVWLRSQLYPNLYLRDHLNFEQPEAPQQQLVHQILPLSTPLRTASGGVIRPSTSKKSASRNKRQRQRGGALSPQPLLNGNAGDALSLIHI